MLQLVIKTAHLRRSLSVQSWRAGILVVKSLKTMQTEIYRQTEEQLLYLMSFGRIVCPERRICSGARAPRPQTFDE